MVFYRLFPNANSIACIFLVICSLTIPTSYEVSTSAKASATTGARQLNQVRVRIKRQVFAERQPSCNNSKALRS